MQPVGLLGTDASFDETCKQLTAAALPAGTSGGGDGAPPVDGRAAQPENGQCAEAQTSFRNTETIRYIESVLGGGCNFQIKLLRGENNAGIGFGSSSAHTAA